MSNLNAQNAKPYHPPARAFLGSPSRVLCVLSFSRQGAAQALPSANSVAPRPVIWRAD